MERVKREEITAEVLIAFCILKNAVDYFRNNIHVLFIDGSHCGDAWKILVASTLDCNHCIQPIGFELCQGESNTSWVAFLEALNLAGVGKVNDLMIYSDCAPAIRTAVCAAFPNAEWSPCAVHVSRNLQKLWNDNHGKLSRQNRENVEVFNEFVGLFWKACLSVTEEEANGWMRMMEELEGELDPELPKSMRCCCCKFLKTLPELMMHTWKYEHMMIRTSNPIESCMAVLKKNITGAGSAREVGFFSRYRILVEWMLISMERRRNKLYTAKAYITVEPHPREDIMCPWLVKEVNRRGHYVTIYGMAFEVVPCHRDGREITDSNGEC